MTPPYRALPNPPPILAGDVSCDLIVNSIDAAFILQLRAALIFSLPCERNGDVNGDGLTNAIDASLILQLESGILDHFPAARDATSWLRRFRLVW